MTEKMLIFWVVIISLTVLMILLLSFPLLYSSNKPPIDLMHQEIALYRQQRIDLRHKQQRGELSKAQYKMELAKLDHELLLATGDSSKNYSFKTAPCLAGVLGLLIPIMALSLYFYLGNSQELSQKFQQQQQTAQVQHAIAQFGSVANIIASLKERVQQDPHSAQGWYLLGKLYLSQQQNKEAAMALARANALRPNDIPIMENYAVSLFQLDGQHLNNVSRQLLNKVIYLSPDNMDALNLMAWDAYQQQHYQQAISYWQKILTLLPSQHEAVRPIKAMILKAQKDAELVPRQDT